MTDDSCPPPGSGDELSDMDGTERTGRLVEYEGDIDDFPYLHGFDVRLDEPGSY